MKKQILTFGLLLITFLTFGQQTKYVDTEELNIHEKLLNMLGWNKHDGNNFKLDKSKAPLTYIEGHLEIECPYDENGIRIFISLQEGLGTAVYLNYIHELQNLFCALHFKEI